MLSAYVNQGIAVRVKDRTIGSTKYGQLANWRGFSIDPNPVNGQTLVSVKLWVDLYGLNPDGSLGELMSGRPGTPGYPDTLKGDFRCAVFFDAANLADRRNGMIRASYLRQNETQAQYLDRLHALPEPVRLQSDFYNWMLFNQPVVIGPMLENIIRDADANPIFPHFG